MAVKGRIFIKCAGCGKKIVRGGVRSKATGGWTYHKVCWDKVKGK